MKKLIERTARVIAAGVFFICAMLPVSASAHATAEIAAAAQATTTQSSSDAYKFTAKKGNSLTKLARRALQLYQEDKKITLTPAAAVYGETTIAQALGGAYLEVGQQVDIPVALLQSTVDSSNTLTEAQLKRWDQYAANVSFDVSYVEAQKPTSVTSTSSGAGNEGENDEAAEEVSEEEEEEAEAESKKTAGAYWWFIGLGALVAIYFVLGGRSPRPRKP